MLVSARRQCKSSNTHSPKTLSQMTRSLFSNIDPSATTDSRHRLEVHKQYCCGRQRPFCFVTSCPWPMEGAPRAESWGEQAKGWGGQGARSHHGPGPGLPRSRPAAQPNGALYCPAPRLQRRRGPARASAVARSVGVGPALLWALLLFFSQVLRLSCAEKTFFCRVWYCCPCFFGWSPGCGFGLQVSYWAAHLPASAKSITSRLLSIHSLHSFYLC